MAWTGPSSLLTFGMAMLLGGCGLAETTYRYRYRITVEVETPAGLRSGSAVHETVVSKSNIDIGDLGPKRGMRTRGEAVAVDLPDGKALFVLIPEPGLVQAALDPEWSNDWLASAERISGGATPPGPMEIALPADDGAETGKDGYPKLIEFTKSGDPKSVAAVDPRALDRNFGAGYRLRRIIVARTTDDLTKGIDAWLPSFGPETQFDQWSRTIPYGDPRGISKNDFKSED